MGLYQLEIVLEILFPVTTTALLINEPKTIYGVNFQTYGWAREHLSSTRGSQESVNSKLLDLGPIS